MKQPGTAEVAGELSRVLTELGDALAAADLEGLLGSESALSTVATHLSRLRRLTADEREALRPELERARVALARCERLGHRLEALTRGALTLEAPSYSRRGAADATPTHARMEAKV